MFSLLIFSETTVSFHGGKNEEIPGKTLLEENRKSVVEKCGIKLILIAKENFLYFP